MYNTGPDSTSRSALSCSKCVPGQSQDEMGYRHQTARGPMRPHVHHIRSGSHESYISAKRPEEIPLPPSPSRAYRGLDRTSQSPHITTMSSSALTTEETVTSLRPETPGKLARRTWPFTTMRQWRSDLEQGRQPRYSVTSSHSRRFYAVLIGAMLIITISGVVVLCLLDQKNIQEEASQVVKSASETSIPEMR